MESETYIVHVSCALAPSLTNFKLAWKMDKLLAVVTAKYHSDLILKS